MNKDQAKGRIKEVAGKLEKNIGRKNYDPESKTKGAARETEGKIQKSFGDVKHKIGKAIDR